MEYQRYSVNVQAGTGNGFGKHFWATSPEHAYRQMVRWLTGPLFDYKPEDITLIWCRPVLRTKYIFADGKPYYCDWLK